MEWLLGHGQSCRNVSYSFVPLASCVFPPKVVQHVCYTTCVTVPVCRKTDRLPYAEPPPFDVSGPDGKDSRWIPGWPAGPLPGTLFVLLFFFFFLFCFFVCLFFFVCFCFLLLFFFVHLSL